MAHECQHANKLPDNRLIRVSVGFSNAAIAAHYLQLVAVIVLVGLALGVWLGDWLGTLLTGLYAEFFRFPVFEHRIALWLVLVGAGATSATALLSTLSAVGATVRLALPRPYARPRTRAR